MNEKQICIWCSEGHLVPTNEEQTETGYRCSTCGKEPWAIIEVGVEYGEDAIFTKTFHNISDRAGVELRTVHKI